MKNLPLVLSGCALVIALVSVTAASYLGSAVAVTLLVIAVRCERRLTDRARSTHVGPCSTDHDNTRPCGRLGNIADDPDAVLIADLPFATVKGLLAGVGLSLTTPKETPDA